MILAKVVKAKTIEPDNLLVRIRCTPIQNEIQIFAHLLLMTLLLFFLEAPRSQSIQVGIGSASLLVLLAISIYWWL